MRICFLGRANYQLLRLRAEFFAKQGHDVHVVSLHPGPIESCTVHAITGNSLVSHLTNQYLAAIPEVYKEVAKIKPDIVDIHSLSSYGIYAFLHLKAPVVATVYGPDVYMHAAQSISLRWLVRAVLKHADLVYGSSIATGQYIHHILGLNLEQRLKTRSWGIPTHHILQDAAKRRAAIRQEFGVEQDTRVILHNRYMAELWRVPVIVEAAPLILAEYPQSEFWFVYPPPNPAGRRLLTHLQNRVKKLGIADKVRFLGQQPYEQMISIMHASDIYVCVATADLLASSILEALCTGLIPVLYDLSAYHEVVKHGENGFFIKEATPEVLSTQIKAVLSNYENLRLRLAPHNRALMVSQYDQNTNSAWLLDQYRHLINQRKEISRELVWP